MKSNVTFTDLTPAEKLFIEKDFITACTDYYSLMSESPYYVYIIQNSESK